MAKQLVIKTSDDFVSASIEDLVALELNKFKGWTCFTGVQSLYIDFDGDVWQGNCFSIEKLRKKDKSEMRGYLGTIYEKFALPNQPVTCPYSGCGCGSDIVTTKFKTFTIENNSFIKGNEYPNRDIEKGDAIEASKLLYPVKKQVLWDVGRRCNYDCSYCWPGVHNLTDPHRTLDEFKQTADYLINKWSNGNQIRWYFGGGEPTLNPAFEPFVEYLRNKNQWTMLVTNASQGPKYWSKNAGNYNILIFSCHFEFLKESVFVNNFLEVVNTINNNTGVLEKLIIKLMTKPGEVDKSIEFANMLKSKCDYASLAGKVDFDIVPLRGHAGHELKEYEDADVQKIVEFNKHV